MAKHKKNKQSNISVKKGRQQAIMTISIIGVLAVLGGVGFMLQSNRLQGSHVQSSQVQGSQVQGNQMLQSTVPNASLQNASVQNVSVNDLANASGEYIVLDVREQWEYDEGHVAGVTLIPLDELNARVSELPDDKAIYVMCRSGQRSTVASTILKDAGKLDIRNVQGGTLAWVRAGLPLER